jgi:glycosyltransferase involved in cell wall biosynthesis
MMARNGFLGRISFRGRAHPAAAPPVPRKETAFARAPSNAVNPMSSLRVLVVTRLFPNSVEPFESPFARQQLAALGRRCDVLVLGVLPALPGAWLFGDRTRAGRLRRVPARETVAGVAVLHPRALYLPHVGRFPWFARVNGPLYLGGLLPYVPRLWGRFDVVLGTFLYPDGCAAAALARALGIPHVIKGHGTDVDVVARWPSVQRPIAAALRSAAWALGVSRPMVSALVALGAPPARAVLLANGVDRALFHPRDKLAARRALGLPEGDRLVVFVGSLVAAKGVLELLDAWRTLRAEGGPPLHLAMVGEGPLDGAIARAAHDAERDHGAAHGRLVAPGALPLARVAEHLAAADVFTLPSHREGTPNVVLEALASGRPVVASRVGGIPDVIADGSTGLLVPARDAPALACALRAALNRAWNADALSASAPPSWDDSAARLHHLLALAAAGRLRRAELDGRLRAP